MNNGSAFFLNMWIRIQEVSQYVNESMRIQIHITGCSKFIVILKKLLFKNNLIKSNFC